MPSVIFVCLGNICRSPAAEGVLRQMAKQKSMDVELMVESCGTGNWHVGQLPDERMREASKNRGLILTSRAQTFEEAFLEQFDLILAADNSVLKDLHRHAKTSQHKDKIHLITHFSACYKDEEIPDPYYLGDAGFEQVLDMIEDACEGILESFEKLKK